MSRKRKIDEECSVLEVRGHNLDDLLLNMEVLKKSLRKLTINSVTTMEFPPNIIGMLENLEDLTILHWHGLEALPNEMRNLRKLKTLIMCHCEELKSLSDELGCLRNLVTLEIFNCCQITTLPESVRRLHNLRKLDFKCCSALTSLPPGMGALESLENAIPMHESSIPTEDTHRQQSLMTSWFMPSALGRLIVSISGSLDSASSKE